MRLICVEFGRGRSEKVVQTFFGGSSCREPPEWHSVIPAWTWPKVSGPPAAVCYRPWFSMGQALSGVTAEHSAGLMFMQKEEQVVCVERALNPWWLATTQADNSLNLPWKTWSSFLANHFLLSPGTGLQPANHTWATTALKYKGEHQQCRRIEIPEPGEMLGRKLLESRMRAAGSGSQLLNGWITKASEVRFMPCWKEPRFLELSQWLHSDPRWADNNVINDLLPYSICYGRFIEIKSHTELENPLHCWGSSLAAVGSSTLMACEGVCLIQTIV